MCLGVCVGEVTGGKGACRARIISMSQCPLKSEGCVCVCGGFHGALNVPR